MPRHIKTAALAGQQEEADARTRAAVEAINADVRVKLVWTPPWDRDRMSEEAKLELGLL